MTASAPKVFVEVSRDLPLVSVTAAQRTGSIEDPAGREGLTRLMARLMRRTGGGMSPRELDVRIDSLGAAFGVSVGHSATSFTVTVIRRSLDELMEVVADVLARPGLAPAELERLKRETEGEIVDARDNDHALAHKWFSRAVFDGHAYGRGVRGTIPAVRAIEVADVRGHFAATATAGNYLFAFSGDIDAEAARRCAEAVASRLPAGPSPCDGAPEPRAKNGRHLVIVDKPERTQTQILIGGLGTHPHDADHTALHVANTVFGGTFTARLTREVRSKRGWSYGAYSSLPFDRHRQAFNMWTFPKADDAGPCISLELELLRQWREDGVTAKELEWAKSYLVRSRAFAIDTAAKRVALALDTELYDLPPGYHDEYVERVRAVSLDDANAAIRSRIPWDDLVVAVVGTEARIGRAVRAAIDDLASTHVVSYEAD